MSASSPPGRFITFEGGEGAGKSLQTQRLAEWLKARAIPVSLTREPGGTAGAEAIRALLVTGAAERWTPLSEVLLFNAARADHVARKIRPALAQGQWVVCDRFADSTRAYQGAAQGLPDTLIATLNAIAVQDTHPDLTFLLDVPVATGLARASRRGGAETRYERHDISFHERLRAGFLAIAREAPQRCVVIDGTGAPDAIAAQIAQIVAARFAL